MQKRMMIAWAAAFCLLQPVPAMAEGETEKTVTVSASESVTAVPDKASVELEIITEGQDSQAVQQENSEKMEEVKKTLEALEAAVKTAESKALTLAHAAGYGSVSAISISEGYQDTSMRYLSKNYMGAATNDAIAEESMGTYVPVYAGESEIEADVTIVYEMVKS